MLLGDQKMVRTASWLTLVGVILLEVSVGRCVEIGLDEDLTISADGILNAQLMPITYLMMDGACVVDGCEQDKGAESRTESDLTEELPLNELVNDASYSSALSTLEFHRTMINLYRCKGFLAKRIINVYPSQSQLFKRMSSAMTNSSSASPLVMNGPQDPTDGMLYDPGSSGYKEWLTKTSTLDDIYENFLSTRKLVNDTLNRNHLHHATIHRVSESFHPTSNPRLAQEEYFDEGIITGYAMQPEQIGTLQGGASASYDRYGGQYGGGGGTHDLQLRQSKYQRGLLQGEEADGYEASRGDYGYHHHHHHAAPVVEYEEKSIDKSLIGLKDLFDIALTTLAYLSFGMFILQVIMCITMTKSDSSMMILPTTSEVEVEEEEGRRFARALHVEGSGRARELNQLAMYVVDSIDTIAKGGPERRRDLCLQACLCKANRFSRTLTSIHGYWISVWSFGVSWLARYKQRSSNISSFALKCMSAALIGLGNGKCTELYPCGGGQPV
ncbi:uncharacterized protein LOC126562806 [Anopheles maculipalpis]|uniref:uncharacterized protein LOC126562806 n=1 Tax=Anopheles maculipalpis TaxID=1496333 RepID=UPI0021598C72|nr:uncharacterized protein LOC126562806 [Anopheles maculipalpis]